MGFKNQLITGGAHIVGWRIPHDLNMKMDGFRTMPNSGGGLWCLWCLWVWAKWSSLDAYWSATDARCQLSNGTPDVHVWYGYVHMSICILYTCNSYTARLVSSACERPLTLELFIDSGLTFISWSPGTCWFIMSFSPRTLPWIGGEDHPSDPSASRLFGRFRALLWAAWSVSMGIRSELCHLACNDD